MATLRELKEFWNRKLEESTRNSSTSHYENLEIALLENLCEAVASYEFCLQKLRKKSLEVRHVVDSVNERVEQKMQNSLSLCCLNPLGELQMVGHSFDTLLARLDGLRNNYNKLLEVYRDEDVYSEYCL